MHHRLAAPGSHSHPLQLNAQTGGNYARQHRLVRIGRPYGERHRRRRSFTADHDLLRHDVVPQQFVCDMLLFLFPKPYAFAALARKRVQHQRHSRKLLGHQAFGLAQLARLFRTFAVGLGGARDYGGKIVHFPAAPRDERRHIQYGHFASEHCSVRHRAYHGRGAPAQCGETPLSFGTSAAIVLCHFSGKSLGRVTPFTAVKVTQSPGHIVKDFAHRHESCGKLRPAPVDNAAESGIPSAVPEHSGAKPLRKKKVCARAQRGADEILPSPAVAAEDEPCRDINDERPRRGRPFGERTECNHRCRTRRGIGKKERVSKRKRAARPRRHRKSERRRTARSVCEQHGKEWDKDENQDEPLHSDLCRGITEDRHSQPGGDELIRRKPRFYPPEKHSITYCLCNKRKCARQHEREDPRRHAAPEQHRKHGMRKLRNQSRSRPGKDVHILAQAVKDGVKQGKDRKRDRHVKQRPRRWRERYDGKRVYGSRDQHILP